MTSVIDQESLSSTKPLWLTIVMILFGVAGIALGVGSFLFGHIIEVIAFLAALMLYSKNHALWLIPVGLILPFYGRNPSFYQIAPLETYISGVFVAQLFYLKSTEWNILPRKVMMMMALWGAFALYLLLRNIGYIPMLWHEAKSWGASEAWSELLLYNGVSALRGTRELVNICLGTGFMYLIIVHKHSARYGFITIAFSLILTLLFGLRHFISLPWKSTHYLCASWFYERWDRHIMGMFGNPGWFGEFLLVCAPVSFFAIRESLLLKNYRLLRKSVAATLLLIFEAAMCLQRATWLGLFGISSIYFFNLPMSRKQKRIIMIGAIALGLLLALLLWLFAGKWFLKRISVSGSGREIVWMHFFELMDAAGFLGRTIGQFSAVYGEVLAKSAITAPVLQTAHNTYIHIAVENGYIGLFLFLLALVGSIVLLAREQKGVLGLSLLTGLAIDGLFQHFFYSFAVAHGFYFVLGLGILTLYPQSTSSIPKSEKISFNMSPKWILMGVFSIAFLSLHHMFQQKRTYGCYLKEPMDQIPYRWCGVESDHLVRRVTDVVSLPVGVAISQFVRAELSLTPGGPPLMIEQKWLNVKESHEFRFITQFKESTDVWIRIIAPKYIVLGDHRQLSVSVAVPL